MGLFGLPVLPAIHFLEFSVDGMSKGFFGGEARGTLLVRPVITSKSAYCTVDRS